MKAILVDFDGTLVDSYDANLFAYQVALKNTGHSFDEALLKMLVGRLAWRPMLAKVLPNQAHLHSSIAANKRRIYSELTSMVKVNQGLVSLLRLLKGKVSIALVTSASRSSVESLLRDKSLDDLFEVIVSSDDVMKQKPDAEPYIKAAAVLGVHATECVVFEDSDIGVESAKAFGAQILRVSGW